MAAILPKAQAYIDRLKAINYDEPYFDEDEVIRHMKRQYDLLGIPCPEIVVADNLVEGYQIIKRMARDTAWNTAWNTAWGMDWNTAWGTAWGTAWDTAWNTAWGTAWDAAWDAARGTAWDTAWDAARDAAYLNTGLGGAGISKFIGIQTEMLEALESGLGFYFPMRDKLVLVPMPRMIISRGRLHFDHGKAVEWNDHTGFYFLHGVKFEEELYWKVVNQELTIADMLTGISSADQRSVALMFAQPEKLLKHLKAKLISTGSKPTRAKEPTKLYEVPDFMGTGTTEYAMTMFCPSTARPFLEWVEPAMGAKGDADLAQAAAFGISKEHYLAILPENEA